MKNTIKYLALIFSIVNSLIPLYSIGQGREVVSFNNGWNFHFAYDVRKDAPLQTVNLPHSWNGEDVINGVMNYRRDMAIYEKDLIKTSEWKDKRIFLYFDGVNSFAQILVNNISIGEHKGGYTAFCLEITPYLNDKLNKLQVLVSNAARTDILPLTGDFNVFGGIHRPVKLIITDKNCIAPDYYASSGVFITPTLLKDGIADINVQSHISIRDKSKKLNLYTKILDQNNKAVAENTYTLNANDSVIAQHLTLNKPHLWNGKQDPYLYKVEVSLLENGKPIDKVYQPLGIRKFNVSAQKGAFLNDKYIDLYGFGFHEDYVGVGSAITPELLQQDFDIIKESGANALRMTHYPHSQLMYNNADSSGILIWSEIPFVGPGGYTGAGYIKSPALEAHAKEILKEMILQNYNHPSVMCWGLFNELKLDYDNPIPFLNELNQEAHTLDSTRNTVCASFLPGTQFNGVSDLIAWNKYYGWYGGHFSDIATWADAAHKEMPNKAFAVSEYGAGGDPNLHTDSIFPVDPNGRKHFEEWQTLFHENNWKYLKERPFVWGKFIWALTDFGSSIRTEGAANGINDKGLVSYDRKIKKDAFYFYKANWNNIPTVYLTEKRFKLRKNKRVQIKGYSNTEYVSLYLNGILISTKKPDTYKIVQWENMDLKEGVNKIRLEGKVGSKIIYDEAEWYLL